MPVLQFKGKTFVQNHHLMLEHHQLVPDAARSLTDAPGLADNLVIQGDNLLTLKALLPSFANRVKCIYIDPPYNTGNENWVYNDNVNSPEHKEWFHKVISRDDLTRHDKWLCMMLPRLKLLRELLRDDGAIFISIDDNEVHHLCALMDELFGEENFIACFIWRKVDSPNDNKVPITPDHEFVVCYAKNKEMAEFRQMNAPSILDAYGGVTEEGVSFRDRLLKKNGRNSLRKDRPTMFFPITDPDGNEIWPIHETGEEACWAAGKTFVQRYIENNTLIWKKRKKLGLTVWEPYTREFAPDNPLRPYPTIWSDLPTMRQAKAMLKDIFGVPEAFDTPKPVELISRLLEMFINPNDIILDSFAGSGTTAQAVLALNAEDGGNRRFILIEQEDYADPLTAERVRRVIRGVPGAKDDALRAGYGGSFTYARLGPALAERGILDGSAMPKYDELARYVFFTTTGEQWDATQQDLQRNYLGESRDYRVYMLYTPDPVTLRRTALTLDMSRALGTPGGKPTLVIAPYKLVDDDTLHDCNVAFCQLPFEIYRFRI